MSILCLAEIVTEDATKRPITNAPELTESTTSGASKFGVLVWMLFWPKGYQHGRKRILSNPVREHLFCIS